MADDELKTQVEGLAAATAATQSQVTELKGMIQALIAAGGVKPPPVEEPPLPSETAILLGAIREDLAKVTAEVTAIKSAPPPETKTEAPPKRTPTSKSVFPCLECKKAGRKIPPFPTQKQLEEHIKDEHSKPESEPAQKAEELKDRAESWVSKRKREAGKWWQQVTTIDEVK